MIDHLTITNHYRPNYYITIVRHHGYVRLNYSNEPFLLCFSYGFPMGFPMVLHGFPMVSQGFKVFAMVSQGVSGVYHQPSLPEPRLQVLVPACRCT